MNPANCCPVCENHAVTLLHPLWQNRNSPGSFKLHDDRYFASCEKCGTIFRFPMVFFDDTNQYGKEYYEVPNTDADQYIESHVTQHQQHNYEHIVALLREKFPPQDYPVWLDVGSAGYPTSFKDYEFHTLEPSHKAVEAGKRLFNPDRVFQGTLDSYTPAATYSGILFNNSFYCMPSPRVAIDKCREFLSEDGVVVVTMGTYLNGAIQEASDGNIDRVEDFLPGDTIQVYHNEFSLRHLFGSAGFSFLSTCTLPAYRHKNMIAYIFKKGDEPPSNEISLLEQSKSHMQERVANAFSGFENETMACLESINKNDVLLYGEIGLIADLNRMHSLKNIIGVIPVDVAAVAGLALNGLAITDLPQLKDMLAKGTALRIIVASFRNAAALASTLVATLGNSNYEIYVPSRSSAMPSLWFRFGAEHRLSKAFKVRKFEKPADINYSPPSGLASTGGKMRQALRKIFSRQPG